MTPCPTRNCPNTVTEPVPGETPNNLCDECLDLMAILLEYVEPDAAPEPTPTA